jgi:hypothetical protein
MKADWKAKADAEAATQHRTEAQILESAERLITDWNVWQDQRMPPLFASTIGAAITPAIGSSAGAVPGLRRSQQLCAPN